MPSEAASHRFWRHIGFRPTARHARAALIFLPNFALAKAVIYLLPLAIAALAPPDIYGGFELSLSIGLLIATLAVGSPLGGINQVYLVRGERRVIDQLALVALAGCAAALVAALGAFASGAGPLTFLVIASLGVAFIHNIAATAFRIKARRNIVAWADGTSSILSGALVGLLLLLFARPNVLEFAWGYLILAAAGAAGAGLLLQRTREPGLGARLRLATRIGLPMTIATALSIWLSAGGRVVVGLTSTSDLAAYGVAFRIAGLTLGIHQLSVTALYARLYAARTREADRLFTLFFGAVGLLAVVIAIGGRYVPDVVRFSALDAAGQATFRAILPLASLHMFYWIGVSMLQLRINRTGLAARSLMPTAYVTVAGIAVTFAAAWLTAGDVVAISWTVALHGAAYFFTFAAILAARGLPHRRMTIVGIVGGLSLSVIALLLS